VWVNFLDRQKFVEKAYQRGKELTLKNKKYNEWLTSFFNQEYFLDVGSGDITSKAVFRKNEPRKAILIVKASGIIAGIEEINFFLKKNRLCAKIFKKDGEEIFKGETLLELSGKQKDILSTERIILNILQRMSGIATETWHLTNLLADYGTKIAATRKTLCRFLDKKAVFLGGGVTHRIGLWDSILIKDNHLETLKSEGNSDYIDLALDRASIFKDEVNFIEIEVTTPKEALEAAVKFKSLELKIPCIIMFDNMIPKEIKATIETLREFSLYDKVLLEVSGKITPKNILDYAKTGIDVISLGYLTHSTSVLDMSLELNI
jgi:nicotinate-nucleotide pyrophosphorylase (carboxylating)